MKSFNLKSVLSKLQSELSGKNHETLIQPSLIYLTRQNDYNVEVLFPNQLWSVLTNKLTSDEHKQTNMQMSFLMILSNWNAH